MQTWYVFFGQLLEPVQVQLSNLIPVMFLEPSFADRVQLSNIPFGLRLVLSMIIESMCTRFEISHTLYLVWYSFCKYGLLAKCEVKMAGYWPIFFFACLWTETKLGSINSQKKNKANIQPS